MIQYHIHSKNIRIFCGELIF